MFAVIKTGGKQYRVAADQKLKIARLPGEAGDSVSFGEVLMLGGDGEARIGASAVGGATVSAEIVEHGRGRKIIVFKKRRRQNSRRKNGHRQDYTLVRITDILADGAKPARSAAASEPRAAARADAGSEAAPNPAEASNAGAERSRAEAAPAAAEDNAAAE